jgi:uncharacterized protein YndB with AHSA1/START domain
MHIHLCTTVGVPVEQVWATVEDIGSHTRWMADAESIEFRTAQRAGIGTEFDCRTRIGPFTTVDRMRVTEWEPQAAMGIEHHGLVTGSGRFTLRALGTHVTDFCWTEDLVFPAALGGRVGERLGRPLLERVWRANLGRLRTLAES